MNATKRGDLTLVQQLLRQGVDPNSHDAVHNTPLTFTARDGRFHIAKALIEAGAHVNWVDDEKVTPLILAALKGHTDIVDLFVRDAMAQRGDRPRVPLTHAQGCQMAVFIDVPRCGPGV